MASGDVFAIQLHFTFAGQECRPGFYLIEGGGGGAGPACQVVADHVYTALGADPITGFSGATTLHAISAQDIQPRTNASFKRDLSPVFVGDVADDNPVPPQDSMLVRWLTAKKGGKGVFNQRGRTYVPGIYSTGQISGFLISDLQDALSSFASLLATPYIDDGTDYQMHCISFNPGSPRTIKGFEPVVGFTIDNQVDIIRRRRPGRGI